MTARSFYEKVIFTSSSSTYLGYNEQPWGKPYGIEDFSLKPLPSERDKFLLPLLVSEASLGN
jgi:hypothetical protein